MATEVSEQVQWIADQWEDHTGYPSAVLSGIRPDPAHLDGGGFHCSINDLTRYGNQNDYSNTRPDDKGFNPAYGAAIDVSMSPTDMQRVHARVYRVWADRTDPRRVFLNAVNTWDGAGDAVRLDFYANTAKYASPDHKWHNHLEVRRRWVRDWTAAKAVVSVLAGETAAQWRTATTPAPAPTPVEDDMTPEESSALMEVRNHLRVLRNESWATTSRTYAVLTGQDANYQIAGEAARRNEVNAAARTLAEVRSAVTALGNKDFTDEQAIVTGVLAGLTPEKIAAAIPPGIAGQVADELARRLTQ